VGKHPIPKPKHLGVKLLTVRKIHGLTQVQLAAMLKVEAPRISEFELGRRLPNLQTLVAYARLGRIPMEFLVVDEVDLPYFTQYVGAKYRGEETIPITLYWRT
jgi:transcriptional regulator with XRE-family HTH domain